MRRDPTLVALAALTALGAVLRFATLDVQSFSGDEGVTLAILDLPLGEMLEAVRDSESNPPLHYVLAWLWTRAFGDGEVGLRSLSALAGTLTVPAAYAAGRAFVSPRAGVIAAGLTAVSPLLVWYSQEGRPHALAALLVALSLPLVARAARRADRSSLAWWAACCALAVGTRYHAGFVVLAEAVWLVWMSPRRRAALVAVAGVACVAAALLPLALAQPNERNFSSIDAPLSHHVKDVPKKFLVGEQGSPGDMGSPAGELRWLALALVLAGAVLLLTRTRDEERRGGLVVVAIGAVGILIPLGLSLVGFEYFAAYLVLATWVPLFVGVAAGLGAARAGAAAAVALAACMLAATIAVPAGLSLRRPDVRAAAETIGPAPEPRAIVMTRDDVFAPLSHYLDGLDFPPAPGVTVREVVVLGMRGLDEAARERAGHDPRRPPAPGFRLTSFDAGDRFTVARYRAPRPVPVTPEQLAAVRLGDVRPALALQR